MNIIEDVPVNEGVQGRTNTINILSISLWLFSIVFCLVVINNLVEAFSSQTILDNLGLMIMSFILFVTGLGLWSLKKWALTLLIIIYLVSSFLIIKNAVLSKQLFLLFVWFFYGILGVLSIVRIWNLIYKRG